MNQQSPAEYTLSQKLTLTLTLTLNLVNFLAFSLGLVSWLVLGFVLVVYSAGQTYSWLIFVVVPVLL